MSVDGTVSETASGSATTNPGGLVSAPQDRISQLKPPGKLDFDGPNLATSWKRWKEEIELYMDLAMGGKDESTKVKLLLYLMGSKVREIYETIHFTTAVNERTLKEVMEAFDKHCNPKKSETVERYKFFQRTQEVGEPLGNFVTDLKLLASTCNFKDLKESLVRDRIICGIQDRLLREDLLKDPDINLD